MEYDKWFLKVYNFLMNIEKDKILHIFVLYMFYICCFMFFSNFFSFYIVSLISIILSEILSIGKEIFDKLCGNLFDLKDILADNIGILLGIICSLFSLL